MFSRLCSSLATLTFTARRSMRRSSTFFLQSLISRTRSASKLVDQLLAGTSRFLSLRSSATGLQPPRQRGMSRQAFSLEENGPMRLGKSMARLSHGPLIGTSPDHRPKRSTQFLYKHIHTAATQAGIPTEGFQKIKPDGKLLAGRDVFAVVHVDSITGKHRMEWRSEVFSSKCGLGRTEINACIDEKVRLWG